MGIGEDVAGYLPSISGASFVGTILYILIFFVIAAAAAAGIYFYLMSKKFNKTIYIYEKIGGKWELARRDKAMERPVGTGGDIVFYLRNHKKYLPRPVLQTGRRIYWYAIREDGEWINFGLEDIDLTMREAGIKYLDEEMRYARASLQKSFRDRYDKKGFWAQYGGVMSFTALLLIFGVMSFLMFDKFVEVAATINGAIESVPAVLEETRQVLSALDNVCASSGVRAA